MNYLNGRKPEMISEEVLLHSYNQVTSYLQQILVLAPSFGRNPDYSPQRLKLTRPRPKWTFTTHTQLISQKHPSEYYVYDHLNFHHAQLYTENLMNIYTNKGSMRQCSTNDFPVMKESKWKM